MHSCNRVHAFSFYSKKQRPHQRSKIETTCQERTNIMIIILKKQAEEAKINALKKEMEEQGLGIHESEGVFAVVLQGGKIKKGDILEKIEETEAHID